MAYDRIYHEYVDYNENHHYIEIYKAGYTNSYNVYYSGSDPINIRHGSVSKSEWDQEIIQGKELTFSFVLPRADVDVFNDLMESQYKDFRVRYYVNSSLKFQGYLKPENLYKRYEKNPPNIEVQLSATDALADLKSIRFGDFNHFGRIITGRHSILQIVKYALEHLEIQANFKVQLNTYESSLNQPTWCPLLHTFVNAERFFEEENPYETVMYCWEVIEAVLKDFNVKFFQKNGEYCIVNYYEGDSFEYAIPWTTLLQTSRTVTSRTFDITQYKFREYIEQQKIHPYASTIMVFKAKNVGGDVSGVDAANWYLGWDINFQTFSYTPNDNTLYLTVINSETYPDYPNYIQHKNGVQVNRTTSNDYIGVKFNYRLFSITHTGDLPIMQLKIEVLRPSGQWAAPYTTILAWGSEVTYESPFAESFRIVESGTYFIRISFVMEYPEAYDWTGLSFYIREKIQLLYAPNRAVQEYIPTQGSDDLEIEYVQRNTKGYEDLREEFYFGDVVAEDDEASSLVGSMLGAFYVGGTVNAVQPSKKWKAFGGVSTMRILDLYARTILLNRSKYKNFLRCTIIDRDHTIEENYILIIEDIPYVIAGFNKNYRTGEFEVDLVELIADVEIVDGYDDAQELTIKSATIYEGTPEPPLGIYQKNHGFEVGNAIGSYIDEFEDVIYFKAIADPEYPELSRVIGVVTEILTDDFFRYKSDGYIQVPENVVAVSDGLYYYLSTTVAGKYTTTPPTDEGTPKVLIGYGTERGLKIEITPQGDVLMTDMSVTGTGTVTNPITLVNDEPSPPANHYYGTGALAVLGYHPLPDVQAIVDESLPFLKTGWQSMAWEIVTVSSIGRTITLTPVGASYNYWVLGVEYVKNAPDSIEIPNTTGLWFVYYDGETLTASLTPWDILADDMAFVSVFYWNAVQQLAVLKGWELHTYGMGPAEHFWQHSSVGTRYISGLAISINTTDNWKIDVTEGTILDEDIPAFINEAAPNGVFGQVLTMLEAPKLYRTGAGIWNEENAIPSNIVSLDGSNEVYVNLNTGGTWGLVPTVNNKFSAMWLVAFTDWDLPCKWIIGQHEGDSLNAAKANNTLATLELSGMPGPEKRLLGRVIVKNISAYPYYEIVEIEEMQKDDILPGGDTTTDSYVTGMDFDTTTRELSLTRNNGLPTLVVTIPETPGLDGEDGREVELSVVSDYIVWRYVGEVDWINLIALSALKGDKGDDGYTPIKGVDYFDGEDGADGTNGTDGTDGVTPHIGENGNWYIGVVDTGIPATGEDGKQIELRENAGWVEWRYVGDATWTQLYEIPIGGSGGDAFLVHLKFEEVGAIVYTVPYACKFTSMIHQQVNAPALSVSLNTNMAQYDDLTVTPDAIGLVTLEGIWL